MIRLKDVLAEAVATRKAPKIGEYVTVAGRKRIGKVTRVSLPSVFVNMGGTREEEFFLGQLKKTTKKVRGKPVWREV